MKFMLADASFDPSDVLSDLQKPESGQSGLGWFFAAVGIFIVLFLIWAVFIRRPRDERARRYAYSTSSRSSHSNSRAGSPSSEEKQSRRRRRRRLNPTLAETGGLPPPRDQVSSDDPP